MITESSLKRTLGTLVEEGIDIAECTLVAGPDRYNAIMTFNGIATRLAAPHEVIYVSDFGHVRVVQENDRSGPAFVEAPPDGYRAYVWEAYEIEPRTDIERAVMLKEADEPFQSAIDDLTGKTKTDLDSVVRARLLELIDNDCWFPAKMEAIAMYLDARAKGVL
jgi:hypothetical protein